MIVKILGTRGLRIFLSRSKRTKSSTMKIWTQEATGESNRYSKMSQRTISDQTIGPLIDLKEITTIVNANKMKVWMTPSTTKLTKTWVLPIETLCLRDLKPTNLEREKT